MKYKLLIGTKVRHGSPGYENEEIISRIIEKGDHLEVEFESGCFTLIKHNELDFFVEYGSTDYIRHNSNAFESRFGTPDMDENWRRRKCSQGYTKAAIAECLTLRSGANG